MPTPDLQALIELSEKATAGEWQSHTTNITMVGLDLADPMKACGLLVASGSPEVAKANAAFIAALVNWFRANHSTLTAPTLPGAGGVDGKVRLWRNAYVGMLTSEVAKQRGCGYEESRLLAEEAANDMETAFEQALAAAPPQQGG